MKHFTRHYAKPLLVAVAFSRPFVCRGCALLKNKKEGKDFFVGSEKQALYAFLLASCSCQMRNVLALALDCFVCLLIPLQK